MEFRQLSTFVTVAELGNFTQAGEKLGYAQSTVTTQIQLLEQELGTRLFERLGKNVALSAEGSKFLTYAKEILRLCTEAQQAVAIGGTLRGTLTIGAVESLCISRLPDLVKTYRKRYPDVEVSLRLGNCKDFHRLLWENAIDLAFFLDHEIRTPDLTVVFSHPEPMVLLAAPEHSFNKKTYITPSDLAGHPLILTENGCVYRTVFEKILSQAGVRPHSVMETGSIQAIKLFTMGGLGISILPEAAVIDELKERRLVKLNWVGPDFGMLTQVAYHKDKWISPPLKAFLDLLNENPAAIVIHE